MYAALPTVPAASALAWAVGGSVVTAAAATAQIALMSPLLVKWAFPLSEIPGPSAAKWSRWWLWSQLSSGKAEEALTEVNREYGPLARIGPNHLITDDPNTIKRMLSKDSEYKKGPWFDTLKTNPHNGNLVSEQDPTKHTKMRKIFNAGILDFGMTNMEDIMDEHVLKWIRRIGKQHISMPSFTKPLDLSSQVSYLAVDIMTHISLGQSFDCVETEKDQHGFLEMIRSNMAIQQFMSVFLECTTAIGQLAKMPFVGNVVAPTADDGSEIGGILGAMRRQIFGPSIDDSTSKAQLEKSLIGRCILRGLPAEEADEQGLVLLAAGADTTSTAIQSIVLAIISDKRVYNRLQDEIDEWRARGTLSQPIKFREAAKLPYLRACIQEGLRMHPPLFQLRERVVPPEGDYINGYRVPGGTFVGLNTINMQRRQAIFGEDADCFRPERWLIDDQAQVKQMTQTLELGFGYGPSKCLGTQIAMMEMHKVVFELLRNFDIAVINPLRPWRRTSYGVFYQENFNVRVTYKETADAHFSI